MATALAEMPPNVTPLGGATEPTSELTDDQRKFIERTTKELRGQARLAYEKVHTHTYMSTAKIARQIQRPPKYSDQAHWQRNIAQVLGKLRSEGLVVSQKGTNSRGKAELQWLKLPHRELHPQKSPRRRRAGPTPTPQRRSVSKHEGLITAHNALDVLENNLRQLLNNVTDAREALRSLDAWEKELHKKATRITKLTRDISDI